MANVRTGWRALAALLALIGGAAALGVQAAPATAQGLTPETLSARGWTCFQTPPFVVPPRIVCANPGLGRPVPGDLDPPRSYALLLFDLDGSFAGMEHLIRGDLHAGQPCPSLGGAYVFRPLIGYYECPHVRP